MMQRLMHLPLLLGAIATGVGGCSFLPHKAPTEAAEAAGVGHADALMLATGATSPASVPTTDDQMMANRLPPICPPSDTSYRVRDLTRPWWDRVYLLPDGSTCRPAGGKR